MGVSSGSTESESSSYGYSYSDSLAQSLSSSMQSIWGPQAAALEGLYGMGAPLAASQMGEVPGAANAMVAQTMPAAQSALTAATGFTNPNSDLARQQTAALADTLGTEFGRTILPQITSSAGLAGGIGGSREALAKGVAAGDMARALSSGATDFYSNAYNTAASMAGQIPTMASQVFNLGMAPFQAAWAPLTSLASILGGPTALTTAGSISAAGTGAESWSGQESTSSGSQFGFSLW